jgi:hypothetical protein
MSPENRCKVIGIGWIIFAVLIFVGGYFYILANRQPVLDFARCSDPGSRTIIESLQAPLDCTKKLPLENLIRK